MAFQWLACIFCWTNLVSVELFLEGYSFQQKYIFLCMQSAGTWCKCRGIQIAFPLVQLMQCVSCFLSVKEFYVKQLQKSYEKYLKYRITSYFTILSFCNKEPYPDVSVAFERVARGSRCRRLLCPAVTLQRWCCPAPDGGLTALTANYKPACHTAINVY